jgi:hypothetical protein
MRDEHMGVPRRGVMEGGMALHGRERAMLSREGCHDAVSPARLGSTAAALHFDSRGLGLLQRPSLGDQLCLRGGWSSVSE